jgi:hypothetical protein
MFRRLFIILSILLFLFACNKGLTPPEGASNLSRFSIPPQGGNPVGFWIPDSVHPVEVTILDELPVDSMHLETRLDGFFSLAYNEVCSVRTILNFKPKVFVDTLALELQIADTVSGTGPYDVIDDQILHVPLQSTYFQLDTLGFTAEGDRLDLITLPNTFKYILEIRLCFVFHFIRSQEAAFSKKRLNDSSNLL